MTIRKLRRSLNSSKRSVGKRKPKSGFSKRLIRGLEVAAAVVTILGFIFGVFVWRDGIHIDGRVISHGQKGGVTAQTHNDKSVTSYGQNSGITAQNVTVVNNYFNKQSSDEKEALHRSLKAKYPLGYAVFAADGKTIHVPDGLSFEKYFGIRWANAKVLELRSDVIDVQLLDIFDKATLSTWNGCGFGLKRKVGAIFKAISLPSITVVAELLEDKGSFVVLALGFRQGR